MFVALNIIIFIVGYSLALTLTAKPKHVRQYIAKLFSRVQDVARRLQANPCTVVNVGQQTLLPTETKDTTSSAPAQTATLLTKSEVEQRWDIDSWQGRTYADFTDRILARSGAPTFPCVYATMGYRSDDHRYVFLESDDLSEPRNVRKIASALLEYLQISTSLGPNTSMVIVGAPSEQERSVEQYNCAFWDMLRGLRICDPKPWPESIPQDTEDQLWTFCFNGEPVFPVMLTPAHQQRWSRNMSTPIVALQPKWVLDHLLGTPEKRDAAQSKVRALLRKYDSIDISPDLTSYGDAGTSEIRQLCLRDTNKSVQCPYRDFDTR